MLMTCCLCSWWTAHTLENSASSTEWSIATTGVASRKEGCIDDVRKALIPPLFNSSLCSAPACSLHSLHLTCACESLAGLLQLFFVVGLCVEVVSEVANS